MVTVAKFGIFLSLLSFLKRSGEVIVLDTYKNIVRKPRFSKRG